MFALFDDVGFGELVVAALAGILFFGKRLPEVATQAGTQLAKLRRSLQDLKNETGLDHEVRKLQRTFEDAIPRDLSVTDMARVASNKMQERVEAARKEIADGLEMPSSNGAAAKDTPGAPTHAAEPPRIGPPASESTIARTREGQRPDPPAPPANWSLPAPEAAAGAALAASSAANSGADPAPPAPTAPPRAPAPAAPAAPASPPVGPVAPSDTPIGPVAREDDLAGPAH